MNERWSLWWKVYEVRVKKLDELLVLHSDLGRKSATEGRNIQIENTRHDENPSWRAILSSSG